MSRKLPIVLTCDDSYFKYAGVVIQSIISNYSSNLYYDIHVISEYISEENLKLARMMVNPFQNISFNYHSINIGNKHLYHLNSYMSVSTYYRFFMFDILKNCDRILYLDCDVIVEDDLSIFFSFDFEGKTAAAVPSPYVQGILNGVTKHPHFSLKYFNDILGMTDFASYFNAGVILFNNTIIQEKKLQIEFFKAIESIDKPVFQDQDILNSVLNKNGGVSMLSPKFNFTRCLRITRMRILSNALMHKITGKRNSWFNIYHFVGKEKPWQINRPDTLLFYHYAKKTPFINLIKAENRSRIK